jgi:hydrogenase maturation protease
VAGILVLGIGNLLMGDEGVGVHAVRLLDRERLPPDVTVVDGGTGGFHLLGLLQSYDPLIMIDATLDGRPPGTVTVLQPKFPADFPRSLTAHDIGLRDLVETAALIGELPHIDLVTVSIEHVQPMDLTLSPPVAAALPEVIALVRQLVDTPVRTGAARVG